MPRLRVSLAYLIVAACVRVHPWAKVDSELDAEDSAPVEAAASGLLRIGPPASAVGAYSIAADPPRGRVFVSNLHTPFLTAVDTGSGLWAGAVDLRDAGVEAPGFPRLHVLGDDLWITQANSLDLLRYDLSADSFSGSLALSGRPRAARVLGDTLWVATGDGVVHEIREGSVQAFFPVSESPGAIAVEGSRVAITDPERGTVSLYEGGRLSWRVETGLGTLSDVLILSDRVFASDRASGQVLAFVDGTLVDHVVTGSDTFSLTPDGEGLLVMNRQGAVFPASGAYEGAPSLVTRLDASLVENWHVEVGKTAHYLSFDGSRWWTANEDSLNLSSFGPNGENPYTTDILGLTLDSVIAWRDGRYLASHLTDQLWRADGDLLDATELDTCGWPLDVVIIEDVGYAPCQEDGKVLAFNPSSFETNEILDVTDTFFEDCPEGLCTNHARLLAAAEWEGRLVWSDPQLPGLRRLDGWTLEVPVLDPSDHSQHQDLLALGGALLYFESGEGRLSRISEDGVSASVLVSGETPGFALVADGDRAWAGFEAWDANLQPVATLPETSMAVAAGAGLVLAQDGWDLVAFDRASRAERARLSLLALRAPPLQKFDASPSPMRYLIEGDRLLVVNTFKGTLELRSLPDLAPLGSDEMRKAGPWAHLDGLL